MFVVRRHKHIFSSEKSGRVVMMCVGKGVADIARRINKLKEPLSK